MRSDLRLRFDYGFLPPWSEPIEGGSKAQVGPDMVVLRTTVPLRIDQHSQEADFPVAEGERVAFVLSYGRAPGALPPPVDAEAALSATQRFWHDWIGRFDNSRTQWPDAVRRSLITLKAMIDRESGGLVAAPTTSLPEAREQFERVLAVANDLGLLAEEYNVPGKRLAGNFPQALSHLVLVNTALGLSGPTLERSGN